MLVVKKKVLVQVATGVMHAIDTRPPREMAGQWLLFRCRRANGGGMMCAPVALTKVARADIRAVDVGLGAVEFQLALVADILGGKVLLIRSL